MIIIGEKLNGSIPSMGKAIAARDEARIKELARKQTEAGANFLDVCASVTPDIEVETLKWMLDLVQGEVDTAICLDSPSPETLVKALPLCNKPGIINSISGEGNKIDLIFPLIADTKWGCICLLCDDRGIPKSVEQRMETFAMIMKRAEEFHIEPSRLYIDPLVVTLSSNETALTAFAECTRQVKAQYPGIHITSGASNVSFGLPVRKLINMAFMILAMGAGMDSAIVDPTNRDMLGIIYAANALLENDEYCLEYIGAYRDGVIGPALEERKK
ncbi:MAG: methyltetrahydrofolate cobalamin methyltransferase [Clostridiales bacterium]|nr:methyltetrahydrofolate cobalamin methyltransferase [Clostridiales bacterium]